MYVYLMSQRDGVTWKVKGMVLGGAKWEYIHPVGEKCQPSAKNKRGQSVTSTVP